MACGPLHRLSPASPGELEDDREDDCILGLTQEDSDLQFIVVWETQLMLVLSASVEETPKTERIRGRK